MNVSTNAIVLRVQEFRESDRLCTLLTDRLGVVRCFARGAKNIKNKNFTATAQFAYGNYVLYYSKDKYILDESSLENLFVPIRDDIEKLALAQYLCELAAELAPNDENSLAFLRLMLGAFHHISGSTRPAGVVKAACEMRMLSLAGYMPDLVMCRACGTYESEVMYFSPRSGELCCAGCGHGDADLPLSAGALSAMRHTVYAELKKLFSFTLAEPSLSQLTAASEGYLRFTLEKTFNTLDFYKSLIQ